MITPHQPEAPIGPPDITTARAALVPDTPALLDAWNRAHGGDLSSVGTSPCIYFRLGWHLRALAVVIDSYPNAEGEDGQ